MSVGLDLFVTLHVRAKKYAACHLFPERIKNKVVLIEISKQRHNNKEVSTMKYEMSGKI